MKTEAQLRKRYLEPSRANNWEPIVPKSVSPGRVLVHNHIRPKGFRPDTPVGTDGFRAWTQKRDRTLRVCRCGWAPKVPRHYLHGVGAAPIRPTLTVGAVRSGGHHRWCFPKSLPPIYSPPLFSVKSSFFGGGALMRLPISIAILSLLVCLGGGSPEVRRVTVPANHFVDFGFRPKIGPISGLRAGSPAVEAGFRKGDTIIRSMAAPTSTSTRSRAGMNGCAWSAIASSPVARSSTTIVGTRSIRTLRRHSRPLCKSVLGSRRHRLTRGRLRARSVSTARTWVGCRHRSSS